MRNFLKNIVLSMMEARQRQANLEIARMMRVEYPNESPEHIAYMLNNGVR